MSSDEQLARSQLRCGFIEVIKSLKGRYENLQYLLSNIFHISINFFLNMSKIWLHYWDLFCTVLEKLKLLHVRETHWTVTLLVLTEAWKILLLKIFVLRQIPPYLKQLSEPKTRIKWNLSESNKWRIQKVVIVLSGSHLVVQVWICILVPMKDVTRHSPDPVV